MIAALHRLVATTAVALIASACRCGRAAAQDAVANFYKGRSVQLLIGVSPGGGYDIYARTLARHMGKHIPGNPTLVPQNMPGAGTLKVANFIYSVAPEGRHGVRDARSRAASRWRSS